MGLRDVGPHRSGISWVEAQPSRLGFTPANDALLGVYVECVQNAENVGWSAPAQPHVHGNDFSEVLVRCRL